MSAKRPHIKDAKDALVHFGPEHLRNAPVEDWQPPAKTNVTSFQTVNEKHEKQRKLPAKQG